MKNKIILNIPHSSLSLPKEFVKKKKFLTKNEIKKFNYSMTDLFTDKLFSYKKYCHVKARYSRIACDVEKFIDDKKEIMAQYGLGVIYKNELNQNPIFKEIDDEYRNKIINKYYLPYHKKLDKIVENNLENHKVILVDCHSFSENIVMDEAKKVSLPDICVGFENAFCSQKIVDFTCEFFNNFGFNIAINYPYFGSMVPDFLFNSTNLNFSSIMIEINRQLYLDKNKLSKNYKFLKRIIKTYLVSLKKFKF